MNTDYTGQPCVVCGAVEKGSATSPICGNLDCFAAACKIFRTPEGKARDAMILEAEHRGARAMLLWLLGAAKISALDAEDGRRAIDAGWVRVEER